MRAYPVKSLYEEMAFIAHHFNWTYSDLMQLDHGERRRWCREISAINRASTARRPTRSTCDGAP